MEIKVIELLVLALLKESSLGTRDGDLAGVSTLGWRGEQSLSSGGGAWHHGVSAASSRNVCISTGTT